MKLAPYVTSVRLRIVLLHLCGMFRLLGILLLAPLAAAIILGERQSAFIFGGLAAGTSLAGWSARIPRSTDLQAREALVVTATSYLIFSLVGSLALWTSAASWIDAFFESMSGFTTTGLSLLDPERLPPSLLFFRAYSQWIGGAGVVVLSMVLLAGPGRAGFQLYAAEQGKENFLGNVMAIARLAAAIYGALTLAGLAVFWAAGMPFFDALLHILATVSTGGFSPYSDGIGHFAQAGVKAAVPVFMLLGAVTFTLWHQVFRQGLRPMGRNTQLRWLIGLSVAGGMLCLLLSADSEGAYSALFHAVSALTTTGHVVSDPASWSRGTLLVVLILMVIGGCTGSTAGGIKLYRLILAVRAAKSILVRALMPREAEIPIEYEGRPVPVEEQRALLGYLALYLICLLISALLLSLAGVPAWDALFECASALGTVGLSAGASSPDLPVWGKLILIMNMWAGRMEIVPLLVLCYPYGWQRRQT